MRTYTITANDWARMFNFRPERDDTVIGLVTFHHQSFDRTWLLLVDRDGGVWLIGNQLLGARLLKGETVLDLLADAIRQDANAA